MSFTDVENPFPGPKPYELNQPYFFGREEDVAVLRSMVVSSRALVLYATSGAGKTSLLHAGLIPSLKTKFGMRVLPAIRFRELLSARRRSGDTGPVRDTFSDIAGNFLSSVLDEATRGSVTPERRLTTMREATRHVTADASSGGSNGTVIVLDQFEDLFAIPDLWTAREPFFADLTETVEANDAVRVIMSLRADFLANFIAYEDLLPGGRVPRYQLERLNGAGARSAIERAFRATDLSLDEASLERLEEGLLRRRAADGTDVRGQYVNAVQLQIVCRQLWDELDRRRGQQAEPPGVQLEHPRFTIPADFDAEETVVDFVDEAVTGAAGDSRPVEASLRRWLETNLVMPDERRNLVPRGRVTTLGMPSAVLDELERRRLLQAEDREGDTWFQLPHDSLVPALLRSNDRWESRGATPGLSRRLRFIGALLISALLVIASFVLLREPTHPSSVLATGSNQDFDDGSVTVHAPDDGMIVVEIRGLTDEVASIPVTVRKVGDADTTSGRRRQVAVDRPIAAKVEDGEEYELAFDAPESQDLFFVEVNFADVVARGELDEPLQTGDDLQVRADIGEAERYLGLELRPGEAALIDTESDIGQVAGASVLWRDTDSVLVDTGTASATGSGAPVPVAIEVTNRYLDGGRVMITPIDVTERVDNGRDTYVGPVRVSAWRLEVSDGDEATTIDTDCFQSTPVLGQVDGSPAAPVGDGDEEPISRAIFDVPEGSYRLFVVSDDGPYEELDETCSVRVGRTRLSTIEDAGQQRVTMGAAAEVVGMRVTVSADSAVWVPDAAGLTADLRCDDRRIDLSVEFSLAQMRAGETCLVIARRESGSPAGPLTIEVDVAPLNVSAVP